MNNRQTGRRRGRGGQRPQGNSGSRDNGNRIDNRARGNAPQLLEKYKNLARDAQLQGDRVLTEYYLQFADHYFRVVAENRARFEESRPRRDDWQGDDQDMADGVEGEMMHEGAEGDEAEPQERPRARDSRARNDGPRNDGNRDGGRVRREREPRRDRDGDEADSRGNRASRDEDIEGPGTGALPADLLPPSILPTLISADDDDVPVERSEEEPAPRRRRKLATRSKTAEGSEAA